MNDIRKSVKNIWYLTNRRGQPWHVKEKEAKKADVKEKVNKEVLKWVF